MGFVLHVFFAPVVTNVAQATEEVHGESTQPQPAPSHMFAAFRAALISRIPGVDTDLNGPVPEGLEPPADSAVWTIGLDTSGHHTGALKAIAHSAADAGLHVLDPQNGVLYRSDRTVVEANGQTFALGPAPALVRAHCDENELDTRLACERLALSLERQWARRGFALERGDFFQRFERAGDAMVQRVVIVTNRRPSEVVIRPSLEFACPRVSAIWKRVLAEHLVDLPEDVVQRHDCDLSIDLSELAATPDTGAIEFSQHFFARSLQQVDVWCVRLQRYMADKVSPALTLRLETTQGVGRAALSDAQRHRLLHRNDVLTFELFSRVVWAGVFDFERRLDWLAAVRDHVERSLPAAGTDRIVPDRRVALDTLSTYLESEDFAREAAAIRQAG